MVLRAQWTEARSGTWTHQAMGAEIELGKSHDFRFESGYGVLRGGMLGLRRTSTGDSSFLESTVWRSNDWSMAEWGRGPERRSSVGGSFADPPPQASTVFQAPPLPAVSPTGASRSDPDPSH
jgi:hypothetical protein